MILYETTLLNFIYMRLNISKMEILCVADQKEEIKLAWGSTAL